MGAYKRTLRYDTPTEQPLGEGARRRRRMDVPRRGTLLRSGQYDNCAKRHSVSSFRAKPRDLCRARMRVNAQEEKRKHGITCDTSSPLETGVLQRDSRVWLHPKRRLACPLGRLPMKPNGARQRRRMDVPRRGTLLRSDQYANCAKHYSISSTEVKLRDLCRARMRCNEQTEK